MDELSMSDGHVKGQSVKNPMFDGAGEAEDESRSGQANADATPAAARAGGGGDMSPARLRMNGVMDSSPWTIAIVFATFWVLLAPDIMQAFLPKSLDRPIAFVTLCNFLLFIFEIFCNFWVGRDYGTNPGLQKLTLFFAIDVVGTVTLIPDFLPLFGVVVPSIRSAMLARAARAARMGARMARFIRMFRVSDELELDEDGTPLATSPSQIGAKVSDVVSTRIVLLVIALIVGLPVFGYSPDPTQRALAIEVFDTLRGADLAHEQPIMEEFVEWYNSCSFDRCHHSQELVYLKNVQTSQYVDLRADYSNNYAGYRAREFKDVLHTVAEYDYEATFQIKPQLVTQSTLSIAFMLISVGLLAVGAGYFQSDIHSLVIGPVENMTALTKNLQTTLEFLSHDAAVEGETDVNEVEVLEQQIAKMMELLQVGFGAAGTAVIEANLASGGGTLNAMKPGQMLDELFVGFIMLERFSFVTEVMQEDVMLYANYINQVVHDAVVEFGGSPNKNMGGAILCVWKGADGAVNGYKAFQKAIATVDSSPKVRALVERYRDAFAQRDVEDYRVELACGLHCGWAIEGTVGSVLKLDATYLSPNVNLAARIETATQQFGVHLMMSSQYYERLDPETQRLCRKLDVCLVKGSKQPMTFWSPTMGEADQDRYDDDGRVKVLDKVNQYTVDYCAAIDMYIDGMWSKAKEMLEKVSAVYPEDQAPKTVLAFMAEQRFRAPASWQGARELTVK